MITRREIEEYRRLSLNDKTTFGRWLAINTLIAGAFLALITITSLFGSGQNMTTVQKDAPIQRAEAK